MSVDFWIHDRDTNTNLYLVFNLAQGNAGRLGDALGLGEFSEEGYIYRGGECAPEVALKRIQAWKNGNLFDEYMSKKMAQLRGAIRDAQENMSDRNIVLTWG